MIPAGYFTKSRPRLTETRTEGMDSFANGIFFSRAAMPGKGERMDLTPGGRLVSRSFTMQSGRLAGASKKFAMHHKLELLIENRGDLLCVEVEGQLAAATADRLPSEVERALDTTTQPVRAVVLNCRRMSYVSGLGWHRVLLLARSLAGRGIKLLLVDLQPRLRVIFDNCNFRNLLSIHPTMAEALDSLSGLGCPGSSQSRR